MSHIPDDLKYTKDSEWIRMDDEFTATCGITDHAQEMLTDIVFVELPEPGMEVAGGEQVAVVESVKAVSNVYSPVSGRISEVNRALEGSPELLNGDPYGEGWMFKIEMKAPRELDGLMDAAAYAAHIESES
ncbi:MAG TPA: glycine cleavage system protein GcvH [Spirochaetota bacterium]|jgi:glycine cleavage system H protein|nr:glycine cleavage system protein GcvH [Spirochaetota bacterium]OPZ39763.1 MAG: Glycine cleavage system H protein [Spirochaetes bacterium ADurb.BinA120]HNU91431.1 glycine cleavage system protein GcvH [Spirochaetota bacterium]HPI14425.1 glycine cleavage system protein GcvH [Spirochaetota bacterium]HPO45926.1 glycine cleavage system protein GcvH [Spirochaetota bacterium]